MKSRVLDISNFRNIGVSYRDDNDKIKNNKQQLLLNVVLDSKEDSKNNNFGGLVIVIGENNTGKSNVSRALAKFMLNSNEILTKHDYTKFHIFDNLETRLELKIQNTIFSSNGNEIVSNTNIESSALITGRHKEQTQVSFASNAKEHKIKAQEQKSNRLKQEEAQRFQKEMISETTKLLNSAERLVADIKKQVKIYNLDLVGQITNEILKLEMFYNDMKLAKSYDVVFKSYNEFSEVIKDIVFRANRHLNTYKRSGKVVLNEEILIPKILTSNPIDTTAIDSIDDISEIKSAFKIMQYDNSTSKFSTADLITNINDIEKNAFFKALINVANISLENLKKAYESSIDAPGYLQSAEDELNDRIRKNVTKRFNKLYKTEGSRAYNFHIKLEQNRIELGIFRNSKKEVLELDLQSEGFKWFFNLFFGLLYGHGLSKDSIVLMDEPAHNLSVPARKMCRDFLKKYGEEHNITFVVVTHDPFLVDIDNLDELRIIRKFSTQDDDESTGENKMEGVGIINDFSAINQKDSDTFRNIKKAFGVSNHIFYEPKTHIVFVEGITDYNYLTTFKILNERDGKEYKIAFLPIGGLGVKGDEEHILCNIMDMSDNPILLVDSDAAGKAIKATKEKNKWDKLTIVELGEIDSKFKEIESCFSAKDLRDYNLKVTQNNNEEPDLSYHFATKDEQKSHDRFIKGSKQSKALKHEILWKNAKVSDETRANFNKILEYLDNL